MLEQLRKLNFWFFLILVWTCWMMNSFNGQSPWYQANPGAQGTSHNWKLKNIREFRKRNLWNKLWKFGNNRKAQKCTYLNLSEHFPFFWFWMMISSNQFLNFQKNMYTNLEMNKWFRKNMFKNVPNSYIWTLLSCFSICSNPKISFSEMIQIFVCDIHAENVTKPCVKFDILIIKG